MPSGIYKKTKEHNKKVSEALKGRKLSEEHKRKLKESYKIGKRKPIRYWLGKKRSLETIEKIRKSHLGKKLSEEHKKHLSEANKGEKSHYWKGGISFEPYTIDWTETLKRAVRERDNYICQLCSQYGNTVHHKDYNKKNCNTENLITLCGSCNSKVNSNRLYWIYYFSKNL